MQAPLQAGNQGSVRRDGGSTNHHSNMISKQTKHVNKCYGECFALIAPIVISVEEQTTHFSLSGLLIVEHFKQQ